MIQQSHSWVYIQKNWKQTSEELEISVHPCSFPTLFTIAKCGDRSMDGEIYTQNGVRPQNGISCSLKRPGNSDVCYNTDEPWGHYAEWSQSDEKGQILSPQRCQTQRQKVDGGRQGLGEGTSGVLIDRYTYSFARWKSPGGCTTMWIYLMLPNFTLENV